jgi:glycosyltransferase involved in cell wall biosynthesis
MGERLRIDAEGQWGKDRAAAFADADAFCLPSETENFGNAVAEAAALGIPVVVSDRCGVAEFIPEAGSRIVPFGDVPALRAGLAWALEAEAREGAAVGAEETRSRLAWKSVAELQVDVYERLLRTSWRHTRRGFHRSPTR